MGCERSCLNFPNELIPISLFTIIHQVILDIMKVHTQTLINHQPSHPRRKEYRGGSNQLLLVPDVQLCQFKAALLSGLNFITSHWSFLHHQVDPLFYMNIHAHIQLIIFGNYSVHQHDHEYMLRTIIISCQRVLAQA